MWSDNIISDVLTKFYDKCEKDDRSKFSIETDDIYCGQYAFHKYFNERIMEPKDILTARPFDRSKELLRNYYVRTGDPYCYLRTTITDKEFEIFGNVLSTPEKGMCRKLCIINIESTAMKDYITSDDGTKYISFPLMMIEVLKSMCNPVEITHYEDNKLYVQKIYSQIPTDHLSDKDISIDFNLIKDYMKDMIIIHSTAEKVILISDKPAEDISEYIGSHVKNGSVSIKNVRLPKDLFLKKIMFTIKGTIYFIYNIASYELVPFKETLVDGIQYKIGMSVLRARMMLIEDNTMFDLVYNKKIKSYTPIASKELMELVLKDEIPLSTNYYGYYFNVESLKKQLHKQDERHPIFYGSLLKLPSGV